jgi:hypothetical protein
MEHGIAASAWTAAHLTKRGAVYAHTRSIAHAAGELCVLPCARRGLASGGALCGSAQLLCALPGPVRAAAAAGAPLVQPRHLAAAGPVRIN